MKKVVNWFFGFIVTLSSLYAMQLYASDSADSPLKKLKTGPESDLYVSDAAFYRSKGHQAVVFVPGYIFNKESWLFLAKHFQKLGVSSLSVNGNSTASVKAAVKFLWDEGYTDIALVGGSMGAVAVMSAVEGGVESVSKIVLLSPVKGTPINNSSIKKLFVASAEEKVHPVVEQLFDTADQPKSMKTLPGSSHAQFIFYSPQRQQLIKLVTDFIISD
jgi:pimeloyl-ACP methyl ester carboxylesterase